jgi:hypothetical protein
MDHIIPGKILPSYVRKIVDYCKKQQLLLLVKTIQGSSGDKKNSFFPADFFR